MTRLATALVLALSFSLACGDDDDGGDVDDCDAQIDPGDPDVDETCKAVGLIVDCLDASGVDADALTDAQLQPKIDECAVMFEFCYENPVFAGHAESVTLLELREQSNMCVG